jgi:hypothetical protein
MRIENRSDQVCSDLPLMRFCAISHSELLCLPYPMMRQTQQLVKIVSGRKREGDAVCYHIPGGGPYLFKVPVALPRTVPAPGRPVSTLHFWRYVRDS